MWINRHLSKLFGLVLLLFCFSPSARAYLVVPHNTVDWTWSGPGGWYGFREFQYVPGDETAESVSWNTQVVFGSAQMVLPLRLRVAAALAAFFAVAFVAGAVALRMLVSGRAQGPSSRGEVCST